MDSDPMPSGRISTIWGVPYLPVQAFSFGTVPYFGVRSVVSVCKEHACCMAVYCVAGVASTATGKWELYLTDGHFFPTKPRPVSFSVVQASCLCVPSI